MTVAKHKSLESHFEYLNTLKQKRYNWTVAVKYKSGERCFENKNTFEVEEEGLNE